MIYSDIKPNCIVRGLFFPELVQVIIIKDVGGNQTKVWSDAILGEWRVE
jgi:hypothetical protein